MFLSKYVLFQLCILSKIILKVSTKKCIFISINQLMKLNVKKEMRHSKV